MSISLAFILSLLFFFSGPNLLGAQTTPPPTPAVPAVNDLETVIADLQENIKDLRRNITSWHKLKWDANLPPEEKKQWRQKAQAYLQECRDYQTLLDKVDAAKLPKTEAGRTFLRERQTFQRELQYLQELLQKP